MPLSEEELRLLEQMERALAAEDPKFVSALQGRTLRRVARMRTIGAGVVFLGGVALLIGRGDGADGTALGIVGFLVMLASATVGLAAWRGHRVAEEPPGRRRRTRSSTSTTTRTASRCSTVAVPGKPKRRQAPARAARPQQGTFMQRHGAALAAPPRPGRALAHLADPGQFDLALDRRLRAPLHHRPREEPVRSNDVSSDTESASTPLHVSTASTTT